MICLPSLIAQAAIDAGMKVPDDPDGEWEAKDYLHFSAYCNVQLNRPIVWGEHWENAKIIAAIPVKKLKKMTLREALACLTAPSS